MLLTFARTPLVPSHDLLSLILLSRTLDGGNTPSGSWLAWDWNQQPYPRPPPRATPHLLSTSLHFSVPILATPPPTHTHTHTRTRRRDAAPPVSGGGGGGPERDRPALWRACGPRGLPVQLPAAGTHIRQVGGAGGCGWVGRVGWGVGVGCCWHLERKRGTGHRMCRFVVRFRVCRDDLVLSVP